MTEFLLERYEKIAWYGNDYAPAPGVSEFLVKYNGRVYPCVYLFGNDVFIPIDEHQSPIARTAVQYWSNMPKGDV